MWYLSGAEVKDDCLEITYLAGPFDTEAEARKLIPQYKSMGYSPGISFLPNVIKFSSIVKLKGFN